MRMVFKRLRKLQEASIEGPMHPFELTVTGADREVNHVGAPKNLNRRKLHAKRRKGVQAIVQVEPGILGQPSRQRTRRQNGQMALGLTARHQLATERIE